ncbi:vacuolar DHA amino acid exporter [Obba rivulosa]|uniref:Vacuolar DHA amino acid exporter n=1 Tax=Obba rivulosa TaxID=1052685 RepID=A0A8E2AZJ4_9APHY|nr:vacuolar DHA amino acid exporter [Obba rivulosa]
MKPVPPSEPSPKVDIEHAVVSDDPRNWSNARKWGIVALISAASMIAGLNSNIYNPAISQIESELHASDSEVSLSLSLFILIQGGFPLIWSAISEIQGRKSVYFVSIAICTIGCAVAATAKSIGVLIGMRCLQAAGSSAVVAIGAATLADIYEPHERGTMMGIYYCAPLLGPSLGPIIGGILTQAFDWRATFWFLVIFTGICCFSFLIFKDTFRRERSLSYQAAVRRVLEHQAAQQAAQRSETSSMTHVAGVIGTLGPATPPEISEDKAEKLSGKITPESEATGKDLEAQALPMKRAPSSIPDVKLSLKDVNPVGPFVQVLRRMNNLAILFASGLLYAFGYSILYTCSRTLANEYGYDALKIGLVLLAYGVGSLLGSILGGRYSDHVFRRLKAKNGGKSRAEMRLESTTYGMLFLPPAVAAYGWICEEHITVAAICVTLFFSGFFSIYIYSSTLAYIVDANVGRSSSAVATNSCFRGVTAFIAAEVAIPLQGLIGDGGLYSLWAGLMVIAELLIVLVWWKGAAWREVAEGREKRQATRS